MRRERTQVLHAHTGEAMRSFLPDWGQSRIASLTRRPLHWAGLLAGPACGGAQKCSVYIGYWPVATSCCAVHVAHARGDAAHAARMGKPPRSGRGVMASVAPHAQEAAAVSFLTRPRFPNSDERPLSG